MVKDRVEEDTLVFERALDIPAGRVQPDAYAPFQDFVREAEMALHRDVVVSLGGR
jgi:cellulose synthase operon protein C